MVQAAEQLKILVRSLYDIQKVRIMMGQRLCSQGKTVDTLDEFAAGRMGVHQDGLAVAEKAILKDIRQELEEYPISEWLLAQKGIGPALSGVLLSELGGMHYPLWAQVTEEKKKRGVVPVEMFYKNAVRLARSMREQDARSIVYRGMLKVVDVKDLDKVDKEDDDGSEDDKKAKKVTVSLVPVRGIEAYRTVSALWAYTGLHTDKDGKAVRRKKGVKANWNGFLKTKMVKVLADCFIKSNSPWREFYDNYKHRQVSMKNGLTKGHIDNRSRRYLIKQFLLAFYIEWRTLEGLSVRKSYAEEYLGKKHSE